MAYEVENGVFALLAELGHQVVVQTVIAGGPDVEETVAPAAAAIRHATTEALSEIEQLAEAQAHWLELVDIRLYIPADNPDAADRLLEEIDRKCFLLAANPLLGRARSDITPELRYLPVGNYLILYRLLCEGVEVVRVVHGARRLDRLL